MLFSGLCAVISILGSAAVASASNALNCSSAPLARKIGYYAGWSIQRACNVVYPEALHAADLTHINFAYAHVDPSTFAVAPMSAHDVSLYNRVTALKELNPRLQVWISVGGWSMNNPNQPTASTLSTLAGSADAQQNFTKSLLSFMHQYGFDGVDLDWHSPGVPQRGGSSEDGQKYASLLSSIRATLDSTGFRYGLSTTVPSTAEHVKRLDVASMAKTVDWLNLQAYDLHGKWDGTGGPTINTVHAHSNLTDISATVDLLIARHVEPSRINLGLGFYGRTFTLKDVKCSTAGCPFSAAGEPGRCSQTAGILSYDEMTEAIEYDHPTVVEDKASAVKIATWGDGQWASFDDADTFAMKLSYANKSCLGGSFVWALDLDKAGAASKYLSQAYQAQFHENDKSKDLTKRQSPPTDGRNVNGQAFVSSTDQCFWSNCLTLTSNTCPGGSRNGPCNAPPCPDGYSPSYSQFGAPQCGDASAARFFCCPNNNQITCNRGNQTSGSLSVLGINVQCTGQCQSDQVRISLTASNCLLGQDEVCCNKDPALEVFSQCGWSQQCGSGVTCPDGTTALAFSKNGGGGRPCTGSDSYIFCCSNPKPYTTCRLDDSGYPYCAGSCKAGEVAVQSSTAGCTTGQAVTCCQTVNNNTATASADFVSQLNAFKRNPTCDSSDIYSNACSSGTIDKRSDAKRKLRKRDGYTDAGGDVLARRVAGTALGSISYDKLFASDIDIVWSPDISTADLEYGIQLEPDLDPAVVTSSIMCDFTLARQNQRDFSNVSTAICEFFPQNASLTTSIEKRRFTNAVALTSARSPGNTRINSGAFLQAIIDNTGDVPFLYTRAIRYQGLPGEYIQEVVFDLRKRPDLQERPGVDIFGVLHFHVDGLNRIQNNAGNYQVFPRVSYVHAYHGQFVYDAGAQAGVGTGSNDPRAWRVDFGGRNGRNGRLQSGRFDINTPNTRTELTDCRGLGQARDDRRWLIGHRQQQPGDSAAVTRFVQLGRLLFYNGIFDPPNRPTYNPNTRSFNWAFRTTETLNGGQTNADPTDMRPSNGWPTTDNTPYPSGC